MRPAHQRLDADDPPGRQVDLRLVGNADLLERHGVVQRLLDRRPAAHLEVEPAVKHLHAVSALLLGAIHRDVAVAEQRLHIRAVIGAERAADRDADEGALPGDADRVGHPGDDPVRQRDRRFRIGILHPDDELVAAHPRHHRIAPQAGQQPFGHQAQQRVAGAMAERVVDVLEMIQIKEQQRELAAGPLAAIDRLGEPLGQQCAVRQAGERVMGRQVGEASLHLLPPLHLRPERRVGQDGLSRLPLRALLRGFECRDRNLPLTQQAELFGIAIEEGMRARPPPRAVISRVPPHAISGGQSSNSTLGADFPAQISTSGG